MFYFKERINVLTISGSNGKFEVRIKWNSQYVVVIKSDFSIESQNENIEQSVFSVEEFTTDDDIVIKDNIILEAKFVTDETVVALIFSQGKKFQILLEVTNFMRFFTRVADKIKLGRS